VHLPDFARTTTFRWTLAVAGAFVLYTLVLFGFVYWQTAAYLLHDNDVLLTEELHVFVDNSPEQRLVEIDDRLRKDPRRIKVAGLFGQAICASACRPAGAMTRSTSSPSASTGCWARLKR
jgi:hypothetical protein